MASFRWAVQNGDPLSFRVGCCHEAGVKGFTLLESFKRYDYLGHLRVPQ